MLLSKSACLSREKVNACVLERHMSGYFCRRVLINMFTAVVFSVQDVFRSLWHFSFMLASCEARVTFGLSPHVFL